MIITTRRRRRHAARSATAGAGLSLVAMLVSIASVLAPATSPVGAATPGNAQVITPIGEDQVNGGKLLDSGDSGTDFSLLLPDGAACTGDSANQDYRIYGYLIGGDIDPSSLQFVGDNGPQPEKDGEPLSEFRQPLYDADGVPYNAKQTANADEPTGPGSVINIPAFSFKVWAPSPGEEGTKYLPLGEYNAGIACWGPGDDQKLDKFWNVPITIEADPSDSGPLGIKWTADQTAAQSSSVTLDVEPNDQAEEGADVSLKVTVTPATAAGKVTFLDGEDELGTAGVADGTAALVVNDLSVGVHTLRATFTPVDADGYAPSTSTDVEYEIVAAGAGTTTTTTPDGSTTTTTTPDGSTTNDPVVAGSASSGPSTGAPLAALPLTGGSMSIGVWGALLVVFGRMAVLLGRSPTLLLPGDV